MLKPANNEIGHINRWDTVGVYGFLRRYVTPYHCITGGGGNPMVERK